MEVMKWAHPVCKERIPKPTSRYLALHMTVYQRLRLVDLNTKSLQLWYA